MAAQALLLQAACLGDGAKSVSVTQLMLVYAVKNLNPDKISQSKYQKEALAWWFCICVWLFCVIKGNLGSSELIVGLEIQPPKSTEILVFVKWCFAVCIEGNQQLTN